MLLYRWCQCTLLNNKKIISLNSSAKHRHFLRLCPQRWDKNRDWIFGFTTFQMSHKLELIIFERDILFILHINVFMYLQCTCICNSTQLIHCIEPLRLCVSYILLFRRQINGFTTDITIFRSIILFSRYVFCFIKAKN